jgi:hypothetical protein
MSTQTPGHKGKPLGPRKLGFLFLAIVLLLPACARQPQPAKVEEIAFQSREFTLVGDLRTPAGTGPFPVVLFVHGDGAANRVLFGAYVPLMERMLRAGYAVFSWDRPGSGESTGQLSETRKLHERAQILLDAIEAMKARPDIDPKRIGLWGISQASYVIPLVLSQTEDVGFMICVSCAGMSGHDEMAFQIVAQSFCGEASQEKAGELNRLLTELDTARTFETYEEYVHYRAVLDALAELGSVSIDDWPVTWEEAWRKNDPSSEGTWNPIKVVEQAAIPVLAIFGEQDSQGDPIQGAHAWRQALKQAGHPYSRVEVFPGSDHLLTVTETGCMQETSQMIEQVVRDQGYTSPDEFLQDPEQIPLSALPFVPGYLDLIEEWLRGLPQ